MDANVFGWKSPAKASASSAPPREAYSNLKKDLQQVTGAENAIGGGSAKDRLQQ
jgi:hypothetical protein